MSDSPALLALDAAYGRAAACLVMPDGRRFLGESSQGHPHSQVIMPLFAELMAQAGVHWRQLQLLAVGIGPGSYTGLRVAAATMAGINAALELPVMGVSSLAVTARQSVSPDEVWVIEDARAGDAYVGRYKKGKALQQDACMSWEQVAKLPPGCFVAVQQPVLKLLGWRRLSPKNERPAALADLVVQSVASADPASLPKFALPAYARPSQAEKCAAHA